MAQEKVAPNKSTPAFQAFEGALFCICKESVDHHDRRGGSNLRERSCLLRCSLRLKARLQNWHLYFFSGAEVFLAGELLAVPGAEGAICVWMGGYGRGNSSRIVSSEERNGRRWYGTLSELAPVL